jgi:hypothetical protein
MESGGTGMKYMTANYAGSQSPPKAVQLRNKGKKNAFIFITIIILIIKKISLYV